MRKACGTCNRRDDAFNTGSGTIEYRCLFDGDYHPQDYSCDHWSSWAYPSLKLRIDDTNRYKDKIKSNEQFKTNEESTERRHKETTSTTWKVNIACTVLGAVLGVLGTLFVQYLNK